MPASKNSLDDHRLDATPESPSRYRPLLQLDNSPSWTAEQFGTAQLNVPPDALPNAQSPSHIQHVDDDDDDDGPPTKHEGCLLSVTPTPLVSLDPRSASSALSLPPPTFHGHTRSPVLVRQPTMLENFSRAVRNYVPTSIPIPAAVPSPPRVTLPISFGNSMGHSPHSWERESLTGTPSSDMRGARHPSSQAFSRARGSLIGSPEVQTTILGSEDGDVIRGNHLLTAYPTVGEGDNVLWSRWDSLSQPNSKPRRVLFLGYPSGFQMWDCTDLASVSEVLNLSAPSWGHVTFAGVLPPPVADDDQLSSLRPLIGVVSKIQGQSVILIYSLQSHEVVKRLPFHNVSSFASSNLFTVISTTSPPTLHVLSSASLTILHTISSSSIFAYSRASTHKPNTNDTVSLSGIDTHVLDDFSTPDDSAPIYSLSHRLLAFTSQPPRSDSPHGSVGLQPLTHTRTPSVPFGVSQAELGNVAMKVGGTVLSGMKSLGGIAYNAAAEYARSRSGVSTVTPASPGMREDAPRHLLSAQGDQRASVMSGVSNLFFSRSAPAASSGNHDQDQVHGHDHDHLRYAATTGHTTPLSDTEDGRGTLLAHNTPAPGSYVKVLDLGPLVNSHTSSHPQVITEFVAAKHQQISHLAFTHDGNTLLVGPKDGQVVRVFQLRRRAHVLRGVSGMVEGGHNVGGGGIGKERKNAGAGAGLGSSPVSNFVPPPPSLEDDAPWHMYNLRRGRTSAVIQDMKVSPDGRWVAIGTLKGTVHAFAINPYGGQPDLRSHMDTKIWNVDKPPLSVDLAPIARLRSTRATGADGFRSDLSFTFVWGSEMTMPTSLLPPQMGSSPSTSSGRSDLPSSYSSHRQQNFKDVLVFDSSGGVLSLRRITIEQRPRESGIPFSSPIASLATSISLPGVGAAGRLSGSPPVQTRPPTRETMKRRSGLTQQMLEAATELVAKDTTVATWQLKRRYDWGEVKRVVHEAGDRPRLLLSSSLAQAELSTCARSLGLVPRSIYLSHQFLFYTLGEDYHALIRRHRLAISGAKIEVRKEVEASAFTGSTDAHFVEDLTYPSDHPRARTHSHSLSHGHLHMHLHGPSSFDEPLASAMSAEMAYDRSVGGSRVTIPMLPNGAAQQSVRAKTGTSWSGSGTRAALSGMSMGGGIPIKVMEGVGGIIRREVDRVRGGRGHAVGDVQGDGEGVVPLEFDEQDEDFGEGVPIGEGDGDGEDLWRAWSEEDRLAVDEAERFDDVLGIMDEDQMSVSATATTGTEAGTGIAGQW